MPNVSFTEEQLKLADNKETDSKYVVERILDKKKEGNKIFYKVKWKVTK